MIPVALITDLKSSVPFLVAISLLALVFSELAAWQAAQGERRADPHDSYGQEEIGRPPHNYGEPPRPLPFVGANSRRH